MLGLARAAVAALFCAAAAAAADEGKERHGHGVEITPFAGYRIGGEFQEEGTENTFGLDESASAGFVVNFQAANVDTQWQGLYARQHTQLQTQPGFNAASRLGIDVDHFQFGGTYLFEGGETRPFIALTAGFSRFDPEGGIDDESFLSGSLGGGVQMLKSRRVGVRLEARVYATLVNSDGAIFCRTGPQASGCAITIHGTALYQWEASAGVVFRF